MKITKIEKVEEQNKVKIWTDVNDSVFTVALHDVSNKEDLIRKVKRLLGITEDTFDSLKRELGLENVADSDWYLPMGSRGGLIMSI